MTERQIGLRKRTRPFTQVPNDVVDDFTVSYRELGLLVRILRMPEGFVIRSEQLANEGKGKTLRGRKADREGREAVRSSLRKLALAGYYRLVRIRFPDGTFAMATDISEEPVETWASQAAVFAGRPVLIYRQKDGTDLVKYPDGTVLPDDTVAPTQLVDQAETDTPDGEEDPPPGPKPENPSSAPKPENPSPGEAEPGEAESGDSGSLKKMVSKDGYQDSDPASQGRRDGAENGGEPDGQIDLIDGTVKTSPEDTVKKTVAESQQIAREWIEFRARHNCPVVVGGSGNAQSALSKNYTLPSLIAGYTAQEIKFAFMWCDTGIPSKPVFEAGLTQVRNGWRPVHGWKPGAGRDGGGIAGQPRQRRGGPNTNENRHIDNLSEQQRDDENPFNRASRQSDYTREGAVA